MKNSKLTSAIAILILVGLFLLVSSLIIIDYRELTALGEFRLSPGAQRWRTIPHRAEPIIEDVPLIQEWMTFSYLNRVFGLPAGYLQTQLTISNPTYPNLTLQKAAKSSDQPVELLVKKTQESVRQYLLTHPPQ